MELRCRIINPYFYLLTLYFLILYGLVMKTNQDMNEFWRIEKGIVTWRLGLNEEKSDGYDD